MMDPSVRLARKYVIVTLMREHGGTGVQTHIAMAARAIRESGSEVVVLTPFSGRRLWRTLFFGLRYALKPLSGACEIFWYRFGHYVYLKRAVKSYLAQNNDVGTIYAHCPVSARAALEARGELPIPVALAVHFNDSQALEWEARGKIRAGDWLYRHIEALEASVLPTVDLCIYVSQYMEAVVSRRIPAASGRPRTVVPNFVGIHFVPPPINERQLMADMITIGTLEPRKNQQYCLRVLAELHARGHYHSLTIVGEGESRQDLERQAQELGIASYVGFLGHRSNAVELLGRHRLCVHPALLENCSIVLLEALGTGTPIVAAANGGTPEILSEGRNGAFWPLDDPRVGADVVERLLSNPLLLEELSQGAKRDFDQRFSFESAGRQLVSVLTNISLAARRT